MTHSQLLTAGMDPINAPMLQGLLGRHSQGIKHLAEPGPDQAQLLTMTQAALRAPDHAGLDYSAVPYNSALGY